MCKNQAFQCEAFRIFLVFFGFLIGFESEMSRRVADTLARLKPWSYWKVPVGLVDFGWFGVVLSGEPETTGVKTKVFFLRVNVANLVKIRDIGTTKGFRFWFLSVCQFAIVTPQGCNIDSCIEDGVGTNLSRVDVFPNFPKWWSMNQ